MSTTAVLPFQPDAMSPAHLAAVSFLARYSRRTHTLYAYQLRRWLGWCETNRLDPLVGIQRAHVELYIRHLGDTGLMASLVNTSMHAVRGYFRFAHINGLIPTDPAVYVRLPKVECDETRTQGLDRLELMVTAKALRAGFHRTAHRVCPVPLWSRDRVTSPFSPSQTTKEHIPHAAVLQLGQHRSQNFEQAAMKCLHLGMNSDQALRRQR